MARTKLRPTSRTTFSTATLLLISACTSARDPDTAESRAWAEMLGGSECALQASDTLAQWGASAEILTGPSEQGVSQYRIPTGVTGEWVLVELTATRPPVLMHIGPGRIGWVRFGADCEPRASAGPELDLLGGASETAFTDADLRDALSSTGQSTVIYTWSPQTPRSVDGYREIAAAARDLDLNLIPLLSSSAERELAEAEATRVGIPEAGLREIASIELILRDAQLETPTVLAFVEDRVSPAVVGYRDADSYRDLLAAFLTGTAVEHTP